MWVLVLLRMVWGLQVLGLGLLLYLCELILYPPTKDLIVD